MTGPRKGFRTCEKCGKNRAERFFRPKGRICATCLRRRVSLASRDVRIESTYGITLGEYDEILETQDGCCAICGGKRTYNLDVDHDHGIERALIEMGVAPLEAARRSVRGLLCKNCNRKVLRSVRDNPKILQRAIDYLAAPPAFAVLRPSDDRVSSVGVTP